MTDCKSAFPLFDSRCTGADYECFDGGMTLREYAAIKLKVPKSGDLELDAMIRESRRADFAGQALVGILNGTEQWIDNVLAEKFVLQAFAVADAMFTALDEQGEERNESS